MGRDRALRVPDPLLPAPIMGAVDGSGFKRGSSDLAGRVLGNAVSPAELGRPRGGREPRGGLWWSLDLACWERVEEEVGAALLALIGAGGKVWACVRGCPSGPRSPSLAGHLPPAPFCLGQPATATAEAFVFLDPPPGTRVLFSQTDAQEVPLPPPATLCRSAAPQKESPCHKGREGEDALPPSSPSGSGRYFPESRKHLFIPLISESGRQQDQLRRTAGLFLALGRR